MSSNGSYYTEFEIDEMKFSEALVEYLEVKSRAPDETDGYTDKWYYASLARLLERMDQLAPVKEAP